VILTRGATEAEASLIVQCLTSQNIAAKAVGGITSGFVAEASGDVSVLVMVVRAELSRIVTALQISLPLLLIVSLAGDSWSLFGIVRPKWMADLGGS
jgi:hypothetical protein